VAFFVFSFLLLHLTQQLKVKVSLFFVEHLGINSIFHLTFISERKTQPDSQNNFNHLFVVEQLNGLA